ncbi:MAG: DUF6580 family putative transport protein [Pseudomonadota bacterium]
MKRVLSTPQAAVAFLLLLAAAFSRLVPHPPNFTPVLAMALFGGAALNHRALAILAPIAAMLLSDVVLGFHALVLVIYGAMALITVIGFWLRRRTTAAHVLAACIASSVLFFLITNLAVWLEGELYPLTLAGLSATFVAALPFFHNTILSTVLFAGLLFAGAHYGMQLMEDRGESDARPG